MPSAFFPRGVNFAVMRLSYHRMKAITSRCFISFRHHLLLFSTYLVIPTARALNLEIISPGLTHTAGNMVPSTITLAGPAFDVSIAKLRAVRQDLNITHTYLYDERIDDCVTFQNSVQDLTARWYYRSHDARSMLAIILPGCIESAQVNQLAASWNVLFISTANSAPSLHDKSQSPSWVTTNLYPSSYYGDIFCRLAEFHKWTGIEILLDENSAGFYVLAATLTRATMKKRRVETVYTTYSSAQGLQRMINFREFLQQFSTRNRILLFLGTPAQLRLLLSVASLMNMTQGDYVFMASLPFPWQGFGNFSWQRNNDDDDIIREAYRSLLLVTMIDLTVNLPSALPAMLASWIDRYRKVPFYRNLNLSIEPTLPQLTSTTAALEILGQILNEVRLTPTFDYQDGTAMANKFVNRTFSTTVGNMSFDRNGERGPLLVTSSYFDPSTGGFKIYLRSEINEGDFLWSFVRNVEWHNGSRLPPNQPVCGYLGDAPACQTNNSSNGGLLSLIVIVVIIVSGGILAFNQIRARSPTWWQIEHNLIRPPMPKFGSSLERDDSIISFLLQNHKRPPPESVGWKSRTPTRVQDLLKNRHHETQHDGLTTP